jgi:hypothetical protein
MSLDHPVGALLELQRHVEAQRLCGLEIDRQLELIRGLAGSSLGFAPFDV